AYKDLWLIHLYTQHVELPLVDKGFKEGDRSQDRGGDGEALREGLGRVADRIHPGEGAAGAFVLDLRHLKNTVRIIRNGPIGVHGENESGGRQKAEPGESDSV